MIIKTILFLRNSILNQVILDLDDYIQREGIKIEQKLLRSKLLLLHQLSPKSKTKTIIRGLLIRLKSMKIDKILFKIIDLIGFHKTKNKTIKTIRTLNLFRIITPLDLLKVFNEQPLPLKLEY